jgi:hypothetical protein
VSLKRVWGWPTGEGWFLFVMLTLAAASLGGWRGVAVMVGFCALVNILGNLMLPSYRHPQEETDR